MSKEYYTNLTIRFFLDELTPQEHEDLLDWVTQSVENHEIFKDIERTLDKTSELPPVFDSRKAFAKLEQQLNLPKPEPAPEASTPERNYQYSYAVLVVILVFGALIFQFQPFNLNQQAQTEIYQEVKTPKGQKSILSFSDGSKVVLNSESTLRYPASFKGAQRKIYLTGEGYFEVARDTTKPFIVVTDELETRVLGTSFNIKSYPAEADMKITVTTGRVAVGKNIPGGEAVLLATLLPNQQLAYQKEKQVAQIAEVIAENEVAWKESRLLFNNQTFAEIAKILERTYNVTILYNPKGLGQCRFTSRFDAKASLKEVLRALAIAGNFTYAQKEQTITIKSNGC